MTDIDFDELDRAVNQVMKQPSRKDDTKSVTESQNTEAETSSSSDDGIRNTDDIVQLDESKVDIETLSSKATEHTVARDAETDTMEQPKIIPKKKQGIYMDMVQPGAAKRSQGLLGKHGENPLISARKEMNEPKGAVISDIAAPKDTQIGQPEDTETLDAFEAESKEERTKSDAEPVAAPVDTGMQAKLEAALNGNHTELSLKSEDSSTESNDDLGVDTEDDLPSEKNDDAKNEATPSFEAEPDAAKSDTMNNFQDEKTMEDHEEPASSPFIADAKVEKRPLGSLPQEPDTSEANTESADDLEETNTPAAPLPEELQKNILAIESHSTTLDQPLELTENSISKQAVVTPPKEARATINEEPVSIEQEDSPRQNPVNVHSTSITQQYKIKENSGDTSHAPIYDTNTHALVHPVKKRSGWFVVIAILILTLVCAGGAAGLFFSGIL